MNQKLRNFFSADEILISLSLADHKHLIIPNQNLSDPGPCVIVGGHRKSISHDGKWHKIKVKLLLPKKWSSFLRVSARTGYYAGAE